MHYKEIFGPTFTLIENFVQYFNDKSKQYQIKPSRVFQYDETIYITGSSIANMSILVIKIKPIFQIVKG